MLAANAVCMKGAQQGSSVTSQPAVVAKPCMLCRLQLALCSTGQQLSKVFVVKQFPLLTSWQGCTLSSNLCFLGD